MLWNTELFSIYKTLIASLDDQVGQLTAVYKPYMQCHKGCSSCCIDSFKISYVECLALLYGFSQLPPETGAQIVENLQKPNGRCPILVDDACALYEHRPVICRAFGVLLERRGEVYTCDLNFKDFKSDKPQQVLAMKAFYDILDEISAKLFRAQQEMMGMITDESPSHISIHDYLANFMNLDTVGKLEESPLEAIGQ